MLCNSKSACLERPVLQEESNRSYPEHEETRQMCKPGLGLGQQIVCDHEFKSNIASSTF